MTEGSLEPGTFGFVSPKYEKVQNGHIIDMKKFSPDTKSSKKKKKEKVVDSAVKPTESLGKVKVEPGSK